MIRSESVSFCLISSDLEEYNMNTCDVLITYCWNRVGYNILRSLSARGLRVCVADVSAVNICSRSRWCAGSFTYPDPFTREEEFITTLLEIVSRVRPRVLLPTHDEGIIIRRHASRFPAGLVIPLSPHTLLTDLSDKAVATDIARSLNIPVPASFDPSLPVNSFPLVFKTRVGNSAKGVFVVSSPDRLAWLRAAYDTSECMLQEFVPGSDYSVDCIRMGDFFFASVYRALVTKTRGGGTTTQREMVDLPELVGYARRFLDQVDYYEVCGIDFRYDPATRRAAFIEVNARYTGGLATPMCAGFDIPWIHYRLAIGEGPVPVPVVRPGVRTKWILGDMITLVTRVCSAGLSRAELRSLTDFRFDAFDDYCPGDRRAFLGQLRYYFSKLLRHRRLNP